jgi:hypothetical protein
VQEFYLRCHALIASEPPRAVLNLSDVADADTKLVAVLLLVVRLSRTVRVPLRILASANLREWITVCGVEQMLRPYLAVQEGGPQLQVRRLPGRFDQKVGNRQAGRPA